jgi:hypothetical protein
MRRYQEQYLSEMASLVSKNTGIDFGNLIIRAKENRHPMHPHIHFVRDLKKQKNEYIKYNISDKKENIKILEAKNLGVSKKEDNIIKDFIVKNYNTLYNYYIQGEFISTSEFLDSLKKV